MWKMKTTEVVITTKAQKGPFGSKNLFDYREVMRFFSCNQYAKCLGVASQERWKTWTCKGCRYLNQNKSESYTINVIR